MTGITYNFESGCLKIEFKEPDEEGECMVRMYKDIYTENHSEDIMMHLETMYIDQDDVKELMGITQKLLLPEPKRLGRPPKKK